MAYVVGSASVEIVPDFRNAQRKLTTFFEAQKNNIRVPVEFDVDQGAATKVRAESAKIARVATDETRKQTIEREQMYARMFDQIEKREQTSAKAQERIREQSAKADAKFLQDALKERDKVDRESIKQAAAAEREQSKIREQSAKEYTQFWENALKQRDLDERAAALSRTRAEREYAASVQDIQREVAAEQRRISKQKSDDAREVHRSQMEYLRDEARQVTALLRDSNAGYKNDGSAIVRTRVLVPDGQQIADDNEAEVRRGGKLVGTLFGSSVADNASRELRTRSTFIVSVLAAAMIAGAPALLGAGAVLVGGIGLAATASAVEVKTAWRDTWQSVLNTTREASADFIGVHKALASNTADVVRQLGPALSVGLSAVAPQIEGLGNSLLRTTAIITGGLVSAMTNSGPAIEGFGKAFISIGTGLSDMFTILGQNSVGAGGAVASLGTILGELLPLLGTLFSVGATLASNTLPLLSGALFVVNEALQFIAPVLPAILTAFAAMKVGAAVAVGLQSMGFALGVVAASSQAASTHFSSFTRDIGGRVGATAGRLSGTMGKLSEGVKNAGVALPLLGVAIALVASEMQDAQVQEDAWTAGILEGGAAAATAAQQMTKERDKYGDGWVGQLSYDVDAFFGLASSMDDATEAADEQLAAMSPLQRAQALATQATNDLAYATSTYGANSAEANSATTRNAEAQGNLAREQRLANQAIQDTIPSAEAAKAALEDYTNAIAAGDIAGAAESLSRYKTETAQAAEEQRIYNAAIADTVPSLDAAKDAGDDLATALRNQDADGAAEALGRYRKETDDAEREQSELEFQIYGTSQALEDQREQVLAATDSGFAMRQANLDMAEAQKDLTDTLADTEATTADVEQANLDYETSILDVATAAGDLAADALPATASALEISRARTNGTLAELIRMRDEMGGAFPASLQTAIENLQATDQNMGYAQSAAHDLTGQVDGVTSSIDRIPSYHTSRITADTSDAESKISALLSRRYEILIGVSASSSARGATNNATARQIEARGGRADGGPIVGPGTGRSDSILGLDAYSGAPTSWVSNGEYVTNEQSYARNRDLVHAINANQVPAGIDPSSLRYLALGGAVSLVNFPPVQVGANTTAASSGLSSLLAKMQQDSDAAATAAAASGGNGAVGGAWQSIYNIVKAAIPQARQNSTYRPGDPGYHGRGKAVDFGFGSGPGGAGSAGLASIARFLYNGYGSTLAELIYDGIGDNTPDIKNGRPHTYNAGTRAGHKNHVHAAVYDWGGALHPGMNLLMNKTGQTEYLSNNTAAINSFRGMLGKSGNAGMPRFDVSRLGNTEGNTDMSSTSVTGFANHGTIVMADMEGFAAKAETSKRASLVALGLI